MVKDLIGLKFKRDKYGLSSWTKTIGTVEVIYPMVKVQGVTYSQPTIIVRAEEDRPSEIFGLWYYFTLNEIVIVNN